MKDTYTERQELSRTRIDIADTLSALDSDIAANSGMYDFLSSIFCQKTSLREVEHKINQHKFPQYPENSSPSCIYPKECAFISKVCEIRTENAAKILRKIQAGKFM